MYQEFTGTPKVYSHGDAHLVSFGPWVKTHPRHVLQQAQYTIAVKQESGRWKVANHQDVFADHSISQDRLTKLVLPASEASRVMKELDEMNINSYSLFQTPDALLQTVGARLFR